LTISTVLCRVQCLRCNATITITCAVTVQIRVLYISVVFLYQPCWLLVNSFYTLSYIASYRQQKMSRILVLATTILRCMHLCPHYPAVFRQTRVWSVISTAVITLTECICCYVSMWLINMWYSTRKWCVICQIVLLTDDI